LGFTEIPLRRKLRDCDQLIKSLARTEEFIAAKQELTEARKQVPVTHTLNYVIIGVIVAIIKRTRYVVYCLQTVFASHRQARS